MSVLVIAEAGVNHNGDETLALKLVDAAHKAGADVVKFQTFNANKLVTEDAKQADYQIANTNKHESQLLMLERLELSRDAHFRVREHCESLGIEFLSTAFDSDSLNFLVNEIGVNRLKIPSGEISNAPFILEHARTGLDIILSTGMCSLADIEYALGILAFGYLNDKTQPSNEAFSEAYSSLDGQNILQNKVTILHCTTEYPAPLKEINLKAMNTMADTFGLNIGYSDHSEGIVVPLAAVARSAVIIEKHFTLDRKMEGPDHQASLEPSQLEEMISGIRKVESAIGNGVKAPSKSEVKNIAVARKSLVAAGDIAAGDLFTQENVVAKRPGNGLSPRRFWDLLGTVSTRSYKPGQLIRE